MSDICSICGLSKDLCMCAAVAKEKQKVLIKLDKRRYGKLLTIIEGMDKKQVNIKDIAKQLKGKLACGGTVKDSTIELQGNHKKAVKKILMSLGFAEDAIEVR